MRKLVYLSWVPVTREVMRPLHVYELLGGGVDVEFWDVSRVCQPHIAPVPACGEPQVRHFEDGKDVDAALRSEARGGTVFLPNFPPADETLAVYRTLAGTGAPVWRIAAGFMPSRPATGRDKLSSLVRNLGRGVYLLGRMKNARVRIYRRLGWVRPHDVVFCVGTASKAAHAAALRVVGFNSSDFEDHMSLLGGARAADLPAEPYAVFLDSYLPHHPDFRVVGYPNLRPEPYYQALRRVFDLVEGALGLPLVVAAHPKADLSRCAFGGRRVFQHRTGELVRDAALVLSHGSISVSYAVLGRKPVLLLHTAEMRDVYRHSLWAGLQALSEETGMPLVDCEAGGVPAVPTVDAARYDAYRYRYLTTPESEGRRNWELLRAELAGAAGPGKSKVL